MHKRWNAVLIMLMMFASLSWAATRYGDVSIQVTTTTGGESTFGYIDYQATISNSGSVPHTVLLIMPEQSHGGGNHIRKMTRQVTVPAGSTTRMSLFQPPLRMEGSWAAVVIDGTYWREQLQFPAVNHCQGYYYSGNNDKYCLLLSRQVGFDNMNQGLEKFFGVDSESGSRPRGMSRMGNNSYSLALSELPVSEWSSNWLSYSRYHGILLTASEWNLLPFTVESALLEYVRCGGSLTVVGSTKLDRSFLSFGQTSSEQFQVYYSGFGKLLVTDDDITAWTPMNWETLRGSWRTTAQNLREPKSVKQANDWFPVIDNLSVPVRGLLLIILIFAILMGPVNLFILARKKRQIWLLWTVPSLSFVASVIVFGYATFAEGWKGYSRTQSLTILLEDENLASTIGVAAFYCPLTPRDGLHFDYETECTPQVERYSYGSIQGREIDWTDDQHFKAGWVASRIPSHFKLRKSQRRREKIVFSNPQPQQWQALNGFGVPVETLYYADAEGKVYRAENLQPGEKATMLEVNNALLLSADSPEFARRLFERDWHAAVDEIVKEPLRYLRPNCYIAVIREPLFVEEALRKQKSEIFESVIYGVSQGVADAG